ncbi:MAG: type II toxin-antitoxin system Phd/YefM family antitoxin [Actinomycetia bacterium]|nr:type II toxin-antitoxin system Phd/YefM family antitoxin [Actinomycetes bacterium]
MENIIGITKARNNIKEIIDSIMDDNERYIVTRDANPEAVIISYSDYLKQKEMLKQFVKLKNANTVETSKDRIREWLSKYGVETGKIPEEDITKMVKELEINK